MAKSTLTLDKLRTRNTFAPQQVAYFRELERLLRENLLDTGDTTGISLALQALSLAKLALNQSNSVGQELRGATNQAMRLAKLALSCKLDIVEVEAGDTAFTSAGNQIIVCNNTASATITLNNTPNDGEEHFICRRDGPITVSGDINGATSINILSKYDTMHLVYAAVAGEHMIM